MCLQKDKIMHVDNPPKNISLKQGECCLKKNGIFKKKMM